jgi:hypothetical protein
MQFIRDGDPLRCKPECRKGKQGVYVIGLQEDPTAPDTAIVQPE